MPGRGCHRPGRGPRRQPLNDPDSTARERKHLTRLATKKALAAGELQRPEACERCGSTGPVDCHHRDYSDHLDVEWLCPSCHREHHRTEKRRARQERVERAHDLREQGLSLRDVAKEMGLAYSTVADYFWDAKGTRLNAEHERRRNRSRPCAECGEATKGRWCEGCIRRGVNTLWTRERIIEAIQECAELIGDVPTAMHFNPAFARKHGQLDRAALHRVCHWPQNFTIQKRFGTWNAALEAAGFATRPGRTGRRAA